MKVFKRQVAEAIAKQTGLEVEVAEALLETPPTRDMGDYAFPCFQLSKTMRKAPNAIAAELKETIEKPDAIDDIKNVGGYLNFFVSREKFVSLVLDKCLSEGEKFGSSDAGAGKTIVIDFCSTNIAKPFHIGHLPTTVIGSSLYKIHEFLGYKCVGINHIGDWGTQFGKLIVAYEKWGDKEQIEKDPIKELVKIYVKFHAEAEKDESLNDAARAAFKAIEDNEEYYVGLWKWFRELSIREFQRLLGVLDVKFDSWNGESFYNDKMTPLITELKEKNVCKESEGALIVDLEEYGMPPCMILRSDGATLYATRDLAAIFYRKETYNFDKVLYCVATQQNLHFRQIFKVIELMGYEWAKDLVHVANGMISMESGAISTRKGVVVYLEDVINNAISECKKIIEERNPDLEDKDEVARKVGIGAVKFSALCNKRTKDTVFELSRVLSFEGETSCYIQYAYARICSIFRKLGGEGFGEIDYTALTDEASYEVVAMLSKFPDAIQSAADEQEPSTLSKYLIDLVQAFNKFYQVSPVAGSEEKVKNARVALCKATKMVIGTGLGLLGIEVLEKM